MNAITTFDFNLTTVRVVTIEGEPWFVATDVCHVLGRTNPTMAIRILSPDEVTLIRNEGSVGAPRLNCVSESGLYKLVMRSDKPQAHAFQDWVTRVVLPSILKTGTYSVAPAQPVLPTTYLSALKALVASEEAKEAAQAQIAQLKPLADVGERVVSHERTLNRIVRTFDGVNAMKIKSDLMMFGYLYKAAGGTYRVYAKHRSLFVEKFSEPQGFVDIVVKPEGYALLERLYRAGKLTMLKGARRAA